ncbi:uncharacterized protein APUU_50126A [Aspergillus puulaauensis]|uniref:Uncharacterized protein n=1 Tax=Aspergillus puulaauensis TaxID=1220207 RepID=A0A7R7XPN1_9EURO|nr:uncharacterized protein APUU_50126A [Aspergillus puulaauensis]BCS25415.1 hypothetical protein APUU_50126A [Aspergillus puulaauensis]
MAPSATAGRPAKRERRDIKSEPSTEEPVKEERLGSIGPSAADVSRFVKPEPVATKPDSGTQELSQEEPVKEERLGSIGPSDADVSPAVKPESVATKPDSGTQERTQEEPVKKERPGQTSREALWNIPPHDQHQTGNETDSREPASDRVEPWDSGVAGPLFVSRRAFSVGFGRLLDKVETTGPFFASESVESAINPGLEIQGIGPIGLPVTPDAAEAMLRACHRRPVPEHALLDGQTAESYELDDGQFLCRNPRWHRQVSLFAKKGIAKLGITEPDDVRVRPEKLIAFREGSFFMPETRPRNDSEYQEHVGTLAICLPSKHEGGDIMVSHSDQIEAIKTSTNSAFQLSYTIFSMLGLARGTPVTSGYRVVLTYSVVHRPSNKALLYRHLCADQLLDALTRWTMFAEHRTDCLRGQGLPPSAWFSRVTDCEQTLPPAVFYKLPKPDSDVDFAFNTLRPDDKVKVAELRRLCNASNCIILLAFVRYKITGIRDDGDHGSSHRVDYPNLSHPRVSELHFFQPNDLDGNLIFLRAESDESLSAYDLQADVPPISETRLPGPGPRCGSGPVGSVMGRQYAHPVALVVPKPFYGPLLLSTAKDGKLQNKMAVLKDLYHEYRACPENQRLRSQVSELCEIVAPPLGHIASDICRGITPIALGIGHSELAAKYVDSLGHRSGKLAEHIGKAIYTHGVQHMQPVLENLWKYSSTRLDGVFTLVEIRRTWDHSSGEQHTPDEANTWFSSTFNMLLTRAGPRTELREVDGEKLAFSLGLLPRSFLENSVVPFVRQNGHYNGFVLGFLTMLFEIIRTRDGPDHGSITRAYHSLLPTLLQHFSILNGPPDGQRHTTVVPSELIQPKNVVRLIKQMNIFNLDVTPLLSILERSITEFQGRHGLVMFFLKPLITSLSCYLRPGDSLNASPASTDSEDLNDEINDSPGSTDSKEAKFIVRILENYIQSYVGPPPPAPETWSKSVPGLLNCCADCDALRHFVEDAHVSEQDFRMGAQRRKHLQNKLPRSFITDTIRTGSPHALHIRKTVEWYTSHQHKWRSRAGEMRGNLQTLDILTPFTNAIGEDAYDGLMSLCEYPPSPVSGQGRPSTTIDSASNALNEIQPNRQSNAGSNGSSSSPASTVPQKREFTELD